jgi:hypothetical protein
VLAALLAPASIWSGERAGSARYFIRCAALGTMWAAALLVIFLMIFRRGGGVPPAQTVASLAIPVCTACGFSMGLLMRRFSPLPGTVGAMALAGIVSGAAWAGAAHLWLSEFGEFFAVGAVLLYSAGPALSLYPAALIRRRRLAAFERGECLACGAERGAIEPNDDGVCPACNASRRVCYSCLRIVDARSGEACPRCEATIDAACWRCGYEWAGVAEPQCPECGGWKLEND